MNDQVVLPKYTNARPSFFRGCVASSRTSREGYRIAGYHLALHALEILDGEVEPSVFRDLGAILGSRYPEDALWRWFRTTFPRCMALVPSRRKATFLAGVLDAVDEKWCLLDWKAYAA
ncbi:MAG: hypothetical protein P1P84_05330 [Deferrisomatales bacterium]|nr:hypothetical protein [Deferrisomatales bacterium]